MGAYSGGGLFQTLVFSLKVDIEKRHNFLHQLYEKITERLFQKQNLEVNDDFLIIITKVTFLFAFLVSRQRK